MSLLLVGLSHRTAPVEIRERLHFPDSSLQDALRRLTSQSAIAESLILSTCNRTEVLAHSADAQRGVMLVRNFISDFHRQPERSLHPYLYDLTHSEVVRHVFRVASSLDSMVLGEPQILGQFKTAFSLARRIGSVGDALSPLIHRAFFVAKRVRSETAISSAAVSVSFAAVELARKIFDHLSGRTVLLMGAGKMSELAAKHLVSQGTTQLLVWNRTYRRAVEMARDLNGEAIPPEELFRHVERADIVICSTGSPGFILTRSDGQRLIQLRKNRPVFIIDIAVPRDVDPEVNDLDNIFLYDIDDLQHVVDANLKQRRREAQFAEAIVQEEVQSFIKQARGLDVAPAIVSLRKHWDVIRREELARNRAKLGDLNEQQEAALEQLTRGILNKILHGPISEIKSLGQDPDAEQKIATIKRMLGLKH